MQMRVISENTNGMKCAFNMYLNKIMIQR